MKNNQLTLLWKILKKLYDNNNSDSKIFALSYIVIMPHFTTFVIT